MGGDRHRIIEGLGMKPWHYSRIKFPLRNEAKPHQAPAGNWIFFWFSYRHDATKTAFRESHVPLHTLGMDGVE